VANKHTAEIESKHINFGDPDQAPGASHDFGFSKTTTMHDLVIGLFINPMNWAPHLTWNQQL